MMPDTPVKLCLLIPCYNHSEQLRRFLPALLDTAFPLLIVDDGSDAEEAAMLDTMVAQHPELHFLRLPQNQGKGAAIAEGMQQAARLGYTHVLQCDADGQHDPAAIHRFYKLATVAPDSLIAGRPEYDESVPPARMYGRRITNFFIRLETAGRCRSDGMCGFRLYPLGGALPLLHRHGMAKRMGADIQLLVEAAWAGIPLLDAPVRVSYPEGGRSHFHMLRDNIMISLLHTKLCTLALLGAGWLRRKAKTLQ